MDRKFAEFSRANARPSETSTGSSGTAAAAPWRLFVRNEIPPAANGGPYAADWLPEFAGFSWVAYGASSKVVISIAPLPSKEEFGTGCLFKQVLSTRLVQVPSGDSRVLVVNWAPAGVGHLAAAAGNIIYIFSPRALSDVGSGKPPGITGLPLEWESRSLLVHTLPVLHFAWSGCGDAILSSAASKVTMWKQDGDGWHPVWQSQVCCPQSVAATTWSYKGFSATADVENSSDREREHARGKATVWWWEEGMELEAVELSHPRQVIGIQWRPASESEGSFQQHRPVLLTSCKDGVVRLWLEIDSGKARSEKSVGKDVSDKSLKPAFFVSALIEVNASLQGTLGIDCFVTWASERGPRDASSQGVAPCEWVVGIGPRGAITLWSLHCLDDINPPRCPRVLLWQQGTCRLVDSPPDMGFATDPAFFKAIIKRAHGSLSVPPSVLDLFEVFPGGLLRWSRVWPPVSSISGGGSIPGPLTSGSINKNNSWGRSSEDMYTVGHGGDQVNLAIHPISSTRLAASVDRSGVVLIWHTSPGVEPSLEIPNLHAWKLCGRMVTHTEEEELSSLCWSPILLPGTKSMLLVRHSQGIHCYLISRDNVVKERHWFLHDLLYKFQLPPCQGTSILEEIHVVAKELEQEKPFLLVVATGDKGNLIISWKLNVWACKKDNTVGCSEGVLSDGDESSSSVEYTGPLVEEKESIYIFSCLLGYTTPGHRLVSAAVASQETSSYDIVSGSEDGAIMLWKVKLHDTSNHNVCWECVGVILAHQQPVDVVAVGNFGTKIASSARGKLAAQATVKIWEIISNSNNMYSLGGEILLPEPAAAMNWFDGGSGHLLLGVAVGDQVQVYVEGRNEGCEFASWVCLASMSPASYVNRLIWGPQGSLLLCAGVRILVLSHWVLFMEEQKSERRNESYEPYASSVKGRFKDAGNGCLSAETSCKNNRHKPESRVNRLLKAAEVAAYPLPCCHPRSILYLLMNGEQPRARACLRHLLSHATEEMADPFELEMPRMRLCDVKNFLEDFSGHDFRHDSDAKQISKTWQFGNPMESLKETGKIDGIISDGPLTGSESQRLATLVKVFKEGPQLLAIVDLLREMDQSYSLDQPGQRFALAVRYSHLLKIQDLDGPNGEVLADSKSIAWALQSDCKDTLLDMFIPENISWPAFRALGVGFWFTDVGQLRIRVGKLARAQYLKKRDPKDCALFYIALDRKTVLSGLFKVSHDERDKPLAEFFARNFQNDKNKGAALKNAYVLMGKHRHELAAAFFLLGGNLESAVSVCTKSLGDPQLALVICHLVQGANGLTARELINRELLPNAKFQDRWLASVLQCLLGERLECIYELIGKEEALSDVGSSFVLDPDVGAYCQTIFSKPGMQPNAFATNRALQISALGLRKLGLPLQAVVVVLTATLKTPPALSSVMMTDLELQVGATSVNTSEGVCWVSPTVANEIASHSVERLVLQYVAQFVEEHPAWRYGDDKNNTGNLQEDGLKEDKLFQDLAILEKKFSLDMSFIIMSLARMSWHCGRPYFAFWLLHLARTQFMVQNPLLESLNYSIGETLQSLIAVAPEILCSTLLACGAAVCPLRMVHEEGLYEFLRLDLTKEAHFEFSRAISDSRFTTMPQVEELVAYAGQIKQLAAGSKPALNKREKSSYFLLALILCLVGAWLKRQAEALLFIVRMMIDSRSSSVGFDLDACFQRMETSYPENGKDSHSYMTDSGIGTGVSVDDAWEVMSVALWNHILVFSKKHLSVGVTEVSYSGFGRVSPRQSTITSFSRPSVVKAAESFPESVKDQSATGFRAGIGPALLSSLSGITSKLRGQLASRMHGMSSKDPLYMLLWGDNQEPQQDQKNLAHVLTTQGSPFMELWKLLSVNEEVCSALRLEGLDGRKRNRAGWVNKDIAAESGPGLASSSSSSLAAAAADSSIRLARSLSIKGLIQSRFNTKFRKAEEALHLSGDMLEAICVNTCSPEQVVVASNNKGLVYCDLDTYGIYAETTDNLWCEADWPQNGWAGSISTPMPTFVSPGIGLGSKGGSGIGLGGAAVGLAALPKTGKEFRKAAVGFGVPGYAGMAAWSMGWEEWEEFDGFVDPPATVENVSTTSMTAHPLRPFFLVGARNTHVYLWKFGNPSATATYGVLPAANVPPPYALASVSSVQFDRYGHRFATSAVDGTVCTWQLEVGGRSNVCPTESVLCFDQHASDVAFVGGSGAIVAATGSSRTGENLVIWNTLAPPSSARVSVSCHEGGARCLDLLDPDLGGSPLIITGGKSGDICVHDFRYITTGKPKRKKNGYQNKKNGEQGVGGLVWHIPKAHSASLTKVRIVPGTSLFLTGSKDGDVKLWDVNKCELVNHWPRVHEKRMFLQHNTRGFGALVQAAVMDLRVLGNGFITCGGDGVVRHFQLEREDQAVDSFL